MARKKKPALHSSDSSPEIDEAEVTLDPYFPPESEPWPGPALQVLAGFRRWAMDNGLKQMDVENWRAEYEKFLRRPV